MIKINNVKILLMGPLSPPFTGQSVAFTTLVNSLRRNYNIKVLDISNRDSVMSSMFLFIQIIFNVLFIKYDKIYFTCSRTLFGSVRDVILMFFARIRRINIVNHQHGSDFKLFYRNLPFLYKKLYYWCYSYVESTIILVNDMKDEFVDFENMKTIVVPNCYNSELDSLPTCKLSNHNNNEINLLYLSNIMKSKGIINLLDACELLFTKYPVLRLDIAGGFLSDSEANIDEIKNAFQAKIKLLSDKFPNRISFLGVTKGSAKFELLWKSDIFILPTYYKTEAFPISILEAMRAGNIILSTHHNYIPKVVSKKMGLLIKPDSVPEIVLAIETIISDKISMFNCQNYNIKFAIDNYNEKKYVDNVCRVLNLNS